MVPAESFMLRKHTAINWLFNAAAARWSILFLLWQQQNDSTDISCERERPESATNISAAAEWK